LAKRILPASATKNKTKNKIKCRYLFSSSFYKTAATAFFINDRLVKELMKVFFTFILEEQLVDIVKCV
jgi:hypothetical protein